MRFGATTINFASTVPFPSPPSASNWLGTDANGGDVLARIFYGTRISVLFGLLLTLFSSVLGVLAGAIQGYYGGKIDLWGQRFIEVWSGMPTLFLIILLSSVVQPGFWWLLAITVLFGWMTLVGVVRAEFLRTRNYDYVRAAQALGVSDRQIILRHMLPNAMVATLTFLPFILCSSITTLTSLDFLGFGLPLGSPSLGELLLQGKNNLQAPWLGIAAFLSVAVLLTLLILSVKRFATPLTRVRRCNMTHPLLAIDNLSIAFRQQGETQTVVHNLSLEVAVGETLALVGESGSGKSISALSVLRLLPTPPASYPSGDIRFHGQSLLHADEATLRGVRGNRIAMIFQEPMVSLNPLHTLEKQLYEVLSLHRGMRKQAARGEILDCLERVGIRQAPRRLADYPHQLSGGERQRVMIAMALLTRPELLIADEPTTALDVSVQAQILQLLRELKQELNMGLLFITHNLSIVRQLADRVAVMQNGRCVEHNDCRALFSAPAHPYTQRLLDSEPDGEPVPLAADAPVLLQADDLKVAFPVRKGILRRVVDHHRVVNSLSFQLRAGETLGLVGESGSGKSTTGLALLRLIPSGGKITFAGQPIQGRNRRQLLPLRRQMQVVFRIRTRRSIRASRRSRSLRKACASTSRR